MAVRSAPSFPSGRVETLTPPLLLYTRRERIGTIVVLCPPPSSCSGERFLPYSLPSEMKEREGSLATLFFFFFFPGKSGIIFYVLLGLLPKKGGFEDFFVFFHFFPSFLSPPSRSCRDLGDGDFSPPYHLSDIEETNRSLPPHPSSP